jgi:hypothetical protein
MQDVKINKGLVVEKTILDIALCDFISVRVSDQEVFFIFILFFKRT